MVIRPDTGCEGLEGWGWVSGLPDNKHIISQSLRRATVERCKVLVGGVRLEVLSCACVCRCRGCFLCRCVLCACDLLIVSQSLRGDRESSRLVIVFRFLGPFELRLTKELGCWQIKRDEHTPWVGGDCVILLPAAVCAYLDQHRYSDSVCCGAGLVCAVCGLLINHSG